MTEEEALKSGSRGVVFQGDNQRSIASERDSQRAREEQRE
jgi:hypothetical protein